MLGGDRLKFLRIYHSLTQKHMAECLGCSTRWIKGIERCEVIPTEKMYHDWLDCCYGLLKPREEKKTSKKAKVKNNSVKQ
jgi:transcriptional regulator with XRE-family HTH domain|uniref:Helix-turn-helix domain protein n=1 Tax=Podoviridae sp. ctWeH21 TaxID=2825255 RepID=A0A8S5PH98_9CAUD|nr:MAG TPA: helix-turn-helix domain protein [Podoviridae sp. ctWeH21]